jgi:hypothetical protein
MTVVNIESGRNDRETSLNFVKRILELSSDGRPAQFMIHGVGPVQVSVEYQQNPTVDLICMTDPAGLKTITDLSIFTEDIETHIGLVIDALRRWRKHWNAFISDGGTYRECGFEID